MQVRLAGFNVDADLLKEVVELLQMVERDGSALSSSRFNPGDAKQFVEQVVERIRGSLNPESFTPETISAAYARISRDPKHVSELRRAARFGVARARKSNENIIFGLGHASVAEHASLNFDVSGISRLASEELQSHRLLSFTEKSQRYITIGSDCVTPPEANGTKAEELLNNLVPALFDAYENIGERLKRRYLSAVTNELTALEQRDLENKAKEDARYLLPLSCMTQMGMTMNARNVEHVVRDLSDHPLAELRELGVAISEAVGNLAPSLVKYTVRGDFPRLNRKLLAEDFRSPRERLGGPPRFGPDVRIVSSTPHGEAQIAQALGFSSGGSAWSSTGTLSENTMIWKTVFRGMGVHDTVPREFELAAIVFEAEVSASCFAQLKRHRMMTLLAQPYDSNASFIVPPSIAEAGETSTFSKSAEIAITSAAKLEQIGFGSLAPYALTNAHRRRVIIQANARELYHFARLRCDGHAQWEIRLLGQAMIELAKEIWPNVFALACGKDEFKETYEAFFTETAALKTSRT